MVLSEYECDVYDMWHCCYAFSFFFGGGGVGEGGDRSNCKMRKMFLCREVKLPIHCFKAVEMLERENRGSKLGKWRADKRKSLLGRDLEWKITQQTVVLKFSLHTWPLLYCFRSLNARKCILQRLNSLSLFRFNRCIVNILFPGTCITMYEMYFFRHLTALSWAIWKEPRQLDLFKNWKAYTVCSFQAKSVQNLSFENGIWSYWSCVYFLSIVCTCRTLGAIKEKKIIVWYFSFFTDILFFIKDWLLVIHFLKIKLCKFIATKLLNSLLMVGFIGPV